MRVAAPGEAFAVALLLGAGVLLAVLVGLAALLVVVLGATAFAVLLGAGAAAAEECEPEEDECELVAGVLG